MTELYTHRIEIYTHSLLIAGAYDMAIYRRASDALNGEQRRFVPLREATIAPLGRAQQGQRVPHLLVDRSEAVLVAPLEEAAPPSHYARDEQVRGVSPVSAMFFTAAFVVRATFYKRPDLALSEALERLTDDFVPLKQVQVFPLVGGFPTIVRDFAALARHRIVALYQVAERVEEKSPEEPPALEMPPMPADAPTADLAEQS